MIGQIAFFSALAIIVVIGIDLFIRQPGQRGDRRGVREPLPAGVDPANLRRRTPRTQALSGAVLIVAALTIFGAVWPKL